MPERENVKIVTQKQLAEIVGCHPRAIQYRRRMGMPHIKICNTVRFDLDLLTGTDWLKPSLTRGRLVRLRRDRVSQPLPEPTLPRDF